MSRAGKQPRKASAAPAAANQELTDSPSERLEELQQAASRLRAIASALPDLVIVLDRDGRYVDVLTEQRDLLYRPIEELKGKTFYEVFPPDLAERFLGVIRAAIETNTPQVVEYPLQVPAGERWFEGRTSALELEIDGRRCVVLLARDVTERKRAEELETQNRFLREELASLAGEERGRIVGTSAPMQRIFQDVSLVGPTDSTVLLLGETGTGKELVARALHEASPRADGAMVKVNCGALPANLAESELFGHEKGAFTGATQQKKGRFELAHRGTLFLDEVGELPPEVQVKLLRVLQEGELERVGGTRTIRIDVRVVAATHRDLQEEVRSGTFRPDLYYRLNVFPISVPPLRERKEDIPALAEHFVRDVSRRVGRRVTGIGARALERLSAYDWPGNVRELANVIERAVILCRGSVLQPEHVGVLAAAHPRDGGFPTLEEMERRHILDALEQTGGVLSGPRGAAGLLGLKRSTLQSRMAKLGIERPPA